MLKTHVIADSGQHAPITHQTVRRQCRAAGGNGVHELHRQVVRIAGGSAVTHGVERAASLVNRRQGRRHGNQRLRVYRKKLRLDVPAFGGFLPHRLQQRRLFPLRIFTLAMQKRIKLLQRIHSCTSRRLRHGTRSPGLPHTIHFQLSFAQLRQHVQRHGRFLFADATHGKAHIHQHPFTDTGLQGCSASAIQVMLTSRLTPLIATSARRSRALMIFVICPGIPKHMTHTLLQDDADQ